MLIDTEPSPAPARRREGAMFALAALVIMGVPFAVHGWVVLNGFFGQDDFILIYRAAHAAPYDFGYLFQDYNGHLQPGAFLLSWVVTSVAPLNYPIAVLPLLVAHAITLWLWARVLIRLFGARYPVLPALAVFASSPLILYPTQWWAYSMQLVPLLLAMLAALHAHLRYLDDGRARYAVLAGVWTIVGLAFYEKAVLIPALLFTVTVLVAPTGVAAWSWALVRHRSVWLGHGALLAGFAVLYIGLIDSPSGTNAAASDDVLGYAGRAIVDTFLPGMFGGPFTVPGGGSTWAVPPVWVRIAAVLAAGTVVAASVLRARRGALAPWLFLAGYLAVDLALVALARLGTFGQAVAGDPRYLADAVPVAVLCAGFALLPSRRVGDSGPMSPSPAHPSSSPVLVVAATILLLASAVTSHLRLAPGLQFREAREYVATARSSLAETPRAVIYDGPVPNSVLISWFADDAVASRVIGLAPERPIFGQSAPQLFMFDSAGSLRPIDKLVGAVSSPPGPAPDCGYPVRDGTTTRIPLSGAAFGPTIARIGYYSAESGTGVVHAGDTHANVAFAAGVHHVDVVLTGAFVELSVSRDLPGAGLCVVTVEVGRPALE